MAKHHRLGNLSVIASAVCLIHCIALPLLLPILPLIGLSFLSSERAEIWIMIGVLIAAGASLLIGFFKYHQKLFPVYLFAVSAVLMIYSRSLEHNTGHFVLAAAAICMTIAHIANIRLCKTCPTCDHDTQK